MQDNPTFWFHTMRRKPKSEHPWKMNELVPLMCNALNLRVYRERFDSEDNVRSVILCASSASGDSKNVTLVQNRYKEIYFDDPAKPIDDACPDNCTLIDTNMESVANWLQRQSFIRCDGSS